MQVFNRTILSGVTFGKSFHTTSEIFILIEYDIFMGNKKKIEPEDGKKEN